jgi:glyoxylate reductase
MQILVTRDLPGNALENLARNAEIESWNEKYPIPDEVLKKMIKGKDGLLCLLTDSINAGTMDAAGGSLKIIANYAVGYNNIDIEAAKKRAIVVTNTPGVLTEATADLTWALLFAAARRLAESDVYLRSGDWTGWDPNLMLGADITGATIGIVGTGRIGTAVAMKSAGFNMKVVYTDDTPNGLIEKNLGAVRLSLDELLRVSDFITLHVPLLPITKHLIGERELRLMKPTAILINTSRGPVIDEAALAEALDKGIIMGAGLDVYEFEPQVHPKLLKQKNAVLLPHIASATNTTREKMAHMAVENLIAFIKGETPPNRVA